MKKIVYFLAACLLAAACKDDSQTPSRGHPPVMVRIDGGTFTMGTPPTEVDRYDDESPQHQVTLRSFSMGKYEVTQAEYEAVIGSNPSYFSEDGGKKPVERVSWYDAVEYCNKLSERDGFTPAYTIDGATVTRNPTATGYRLPTEAEWEYACRAGTTTAYSVGATITTDQANYNASGKSGTVEVGSYAANPWGLYDMHGNVWEWCWDWYGGYPSDPQTNPTGADSGGYRVIRGGSWISSGQRLRSGWRDYSASSSSGNFLGFRLVRPLAP